MQTIASDASASSDLETILLTSRCKAVVLMALLHGASSTGSLKRRGCGSMAFPVRRLVLVHPQKSGPT